MECRQVQELISFYFDGQLSTGSRPAVVSHLDRCVACREELARYSRLSQRFKSLADPAPPPTMWTNIAAALDAESPPPAAAAPGLRTAAAWWSWRMGLFTTAALVLVVAGTVWSVATFWHGHHAHPELAADFDQFLEQFQADPAAAQDILLAKYDGRRVDLSEATRQLGYRPAVAAGLPPGYAVESMYVLDMPCCKCLKTVCRRDGGKMFAIFEHEEEQHVWFGDRPRIDTQCNSQPCSLVEANETLVASWQNRQRRLTVVGVADLDEVAALMAYFENAPGV